MMDIGYKLGNLSSGAAASSHGLEGILLGDEQRTDYNQSVKKNATYSQASFTRTLKWIPRQVSVLQRCPYHRGSRGLYEGGLLGTRRTVCKKDTFVFNELNNKSDLTVFN